MDKEDLDKYPLEPGISQIWFINDDGQPVVDTYIGVGSDGTLETVDWVGIRPEKVFRISRSKPNDLR